MSDMTSTPQPLCAMCNEPGTKVCKACSCNYYCSLQCQKNDWPIHKLLCKTLSQFSSKPCPHYFRIIYFPEEGPRPTFAWVRIDHDGNIPVAGMQGGMDVSSLRIAENPHGRMKPGKPWDWNLVLDREHATHCLMALADKDGIGACVGSPNKSVEKIDEELSNLFRGPFLFYGINRDLDTMDLRHIADYLRIRYYQQIMNLGVNKLPGVRINCFGDRKILHLPMFEAFEAPVDIIERQKHLPESQLPVSDAIGIPLEMDDMPRTLFWRDRKVQGEDGGKNVGRTHLNPRLYRVPGTIAVLRKDRKPLHVAHVEALFDYCVSINKEMPKPDPPEGMTVDETKEYIMNYCGAKAEHLVRRASKKGFSDFFNQWLTWESNRHYGEVVSPYDV